MAGSERPDDAFAVQHAAEYVPADVLGDQAVRVRSAAGEGALLCHASGALSGPHPHVSQLLVVVHGALRNSADYLAHAQRAADLAGVSGCTLAVAPQFLADTDLRPGRRLPDRALRWDVEGWKGGLPALAPVPVSSFTAMDCLLRRLTRVTWPPGTASAPHPGRERTVIIVGNSAGGQFVNRYAVVGLEPQALVRKGITVRFVVANPSSYLYFSADRPVMIPAGTPAVNHWRYGFVNPPAYVNLSPAQYLARYLSRDVSIVLGAEDRDPAALLLEVSPPAMAQGANRLERGIRYQQHVRAMASEVNLPARHRFILLPDTGHDAGRILAAERTLEVLFGP